jgi:hypothetical protein
LYILIFMILKEKLESLGDKTTSVPVCPPRISYETTRDRTRGYNVRSTIRDAWAITRPIVLTHCVYNWQWRNEYWLWA